MLTKCAGSAVLTHDQPAKGEEAEVGAAWGTMVHLWKETGEIKHSSKRTANAFARAIEESGTDRTELWPIGGQHEVSVAVRVDGEREARRDPERRLVGAKGWITGTDDFQWWLFDGELWIDDLKTGKVYPNPLPGVIGHIPGIDVGANRYPQDVRSAQLKFYALAVATILGYHGDVHVSLTHWPRLPLEYRHRHPSRDWTTYSSEELLTFWGELERLYDEVYRDKLELRPGDHCRFCPAANNCFAAKEDF